MSFSFTVPANYGYGKRKARRRSFYRGSVALEPVAFDVTA